MPAGSPAAPRSCTNPPLVVLRTRMPNSSASPVMCSRWGDTGCSPVFVGWMYVITVLAEPSCGPLYLLSLTVDEAPMDSPVFIVGRRGRDALDLRTGPVLSRFSGTLYDDEVGEPGSTVNDFRRGIGFGDMTGGGAPLPVLCCQRSSTVLCLLPGEEEKPLSGVGEPSGDVTFKDALFSTMFFTKPRPFSLLRLGVGSLEAGGLRNAGEGLFDGI